MNLKNRSDFLVLAIAVVLFPWVVTASIDHLPDRLATHFDADGRADGWMAKERFRMTMAGVMMALPLFLILVTLLVRHIPDRFINLPNRSFWLSPERRDETFAAILNFGMVAAAATLALFSMLYREVIHANEAPVAIFAPPWYVFTIPILIIAVAVLRLVMKFLSVPSGR